MNAFVTMVQAIGSAVALSDAWEAASAPDAHVWDHLDILDDLAARLIVNMTRVGISTGTLEMHELAAVARFTALKV